MGEMTLLEWAAAYIKYKDTVKCRIHGFSVDEKKNRVDIENKDGTKETFICTEELGSLDVSKLNDEKIVCLNRKENLEWLLSNWDGVKDKKCIFFFVNPRKSENWAVNPHVHHSVTDRAALKPGLKALFESIGAVD
jgi:hypothetical protein